MRTTLYHDGIKAPDGYHWVAKPEGPNWRIEDGQRRCRYMVNRQTCREPAVAALNRGRRSRRGDRSDSWWAYCSDHLFGHWVEDGQIWTWVLREIGEAE